jgi:hypothetical protein
MSVKNSGLGPAPRAPRAPSGTQLNTNQAEYQISFDKNAFAEFIKSQGVRVTHFRAIPDPTGMNSRGDTHAVSGTRQSSDGFIYKRIGTAQVLFTTNSANWDAQSEGSIQHATAYMTLPEKYDDIDEPMMVTPWDRLFLEDIEGRVINIQYIEASSTGLDRLQFPATFVEHLIDADGIEYKQGQDFGLTTDGDIKWLGQKRPGTNPTFGRGKVYSIRYRYRSFWIVASLGHEIRVSQVTDPATYQRSVERMPYQIRVVREYIFQDVNNSPDKSIMDHRFQLAPAPSGTMGPQQ